MSLEVTEAKILNLIEDEFHEGTDRFELSEHEMLQVIQCGYQMGQIDLLNDLIREREHDE